MKIFKTNRTIQPIHESDTDIVFEKGNAYKLVITGIGDNAKMPSLVNSNGKYLPWMEGFANFNFSYDPDKGETLVEEKYRNENNMLFMYITDVEINNVTNISDLAFSMCDELVSCKIGEGVTEIGMVAFGGCDNLRTIKFPNSLKKIGKGAFGSCGLESVDLNGVEEIGDSAFANCNNLRIVKFGNNTSNVGNEAFRECDGLRKIDMKNVQTLGENVFQDSNKIETIKIKSNNINIKSNSFNSVGSKTIIYVVNNSVEETIRNTYSNGTQLNIQVKTPEEMDNL